MESPSILVASHHCALPSMLRPRGVGRQTGLTLVELMVALVVGLVVALAAMAALIMARQGFTSVDTSAQLRENARFAGSVLQRIIVEAGFSDPVVNGFSTVAPG